MTIVALILTTLLSTQNSFACVPDLNQVSIFEVKKPGAKVATAKTGDYLRFSLRTPETFATEPSDQSSLSFKNNSAFTLVNQFVENHTRPEFPGATDEGRLISQKEYVLYFKIKASGKNTLEISVEDENGKVEVKQDVNATARPVTRGC